MSSKPDAFKIGLFVVLSLLMGTGMLLWLGASRFFESSRKVVAYFSESVQGLEQDSSVKFRGVTVGRVRAIRMAPDAQLIEVVMSLSDKFRLSDDLGVKISLLGITGKKYLEMDRFPEERQQEPVELDFTPRYPVIATYPSDIKEFGTAVDKLLTKVTAVDINRIAVHLGNVSEKLDRMLEAEKVDKFTSDAVEAANSMKLAAKRLNDALDRAQIGPRTAKTLEKSSEFLDEATSTARNANKMIHRADSNLNRLSIKFERVAENLLDFTKTIKKKPSLFLYGTPRERKEQ